MLVRFVDEWATFLPAGALEPIRGELGLTYAQAAGVLVALPAGGVLGNIFLVAADYLSRRLLASLGALAYGLALIAFGLAHTLPMLLLAAFLWGAASDAFVHGSEVALVDLAGDDLPLALARMNGWAAVGDLLGPLTLAAGAAIGFGWRGAFLGLGGLMLGYAAWLGSMKLPPPHPPERAPHPLVGVLTILKDRRVLFLALVLGVYCPLDEPLDGFMIAYLERVRGLSVEAATLLIMTVLLGGMAGYAAFEQLVGARPARRVIIGCAVLMTCALPAVLFAPVIALQAAAGLVFGAAGSVFYTTLETAVLSQRPGQAGATSAVVSSVGMLGIGFPAIVGLVAASYGLVAGLSLYAVIPPIILALVALGGPLAAAPARRDSGSSMDLRSARAGAVEAAIVLHGPRQQARGLARQLRQPKVSRLLGLTSAAHIADLAAEQPPIQRLGDEGDRADRIGAVDGADVVAAGHRDHRQVASRRKMSTLSNRGSEVEQDDVWRAMSASSANAASPSPTAFTGLVRGQMDERELAQDRVVVHEQNPQHVPIDGRSGTIGSDNAGIGPRSSRKIQQVNLPTVINPR